MLSLVLIGSAGLATGSLYLRFIFGDELGKRRLKQFYLYAIAIGCGFYGFILFGGLSRCPRVLDPPFGHP
jgi:hypothetical protein